MRFVEAHVTSIEVKWLGNFHGSMSLIIASREVACIFLLGLEGSHGRKFRLRLHGVSLVTLKISTSPRSVTYGVQLTQRFLDG